MHTATFIVFGIYLVIAIIIISIVVFVISQAFRFGFLSKKTKRIGMGISVLTSLLLVLGLVALFMIDWATWTV